MTFTAKAYYRRDHGTDPVAVTTASDVDRIIDDLLADLEGDNSVAAIYVNERPLTERGYPDHELRIAVDATRKVGAVRYAGNREAWYIRGAVNPAEEVEYFFTGHDESWPQDSDLDIAEVRTAAKAFLGSGGERPQAAGWTPWPT